MLLCLISYDLFSAPVWGFYAVDRTSRMLIFLTYLQVQCTGPVHFSFMHPLFISISKNDSLISPDRCWESIDDPRWWIIKAPILVTILVSQGAALAAASSHTALLNALMSLMAGVCSHGR